MEASRDTHVVMDGLLSQERKVFPKHLSSVMKNVHSKDRLLFLLIMALATFLRFYQFPSLPAGLSEDEVSAGYESFALLLRGTDRWGDRFPPYFPTWGSGQNVLLSYLNIPFIKIFGLTAFGVRLSSALLGLLTIGVFYAFIKKWYGTQTALIASFLLATNPWHITISRWSLEANLLPFFLLFGMAFLSYCYTSTYSYRLIPFSLSFLALAFYAYGVSIIVIFVFLLLYFGFISLQRFAEVLKHHRERTNGTGKGSIFLKIGIGTTWRSKLGVLLSFLIFFLIASPFLLFIVDNYILHKTPSLVQYLPLTIPLLPSNRLAQVIAEQSNTLAFNIHFLLSGFKEQPSDFPEGYLPLGLLCVPLMPLAFLLVPLGISYSITRRQVYPNLFLIWLVATIPLFFLFPLNIHRINAIYLPLIALSAIGISGIYASIDKKETKMFVLSVVLVTLTIYNGMFCLYYFTTYNNDSKDFFNAGFDTALMHARSSASANEPIYVSNVVDSNYAYVYTLFYLKADPLDFHKHSHVFLSNGTYHVRNYRNYYFYHHDEPELTSAPSFVAILKDGEQVSCGHTQILYSEGNWAVERCFNGSSKEAR